MRVRSHEGVAAAGVEPKLVEGACDHPTLQRIVERFQHLRDERLRRIRRTLSHEQRSFFDLLPLLMGLLQEGQVIARVDLGVIHDVIAA